ncbi:antibiotic biosynthesis monooxygenase [Nakamurella sp. YIM 132087]|uniref:Antibiotic biosynthesis monooxygenase n=1 Tax=Nakamurella alba TaxID=2665158 RepID=A0A7K1FJU2_9ACTN|nr:antibiotic biosynthesis monooxygenase [Nakamurella alba]
MLVTGTFRIPADRIEPARPVLAAMIRASRAESGCLEYAYALDVMDAGLVRVHERWADRAALDRHTASLHLTAWRASWDELGIGERHLRSYEAGTSSPL